VIDPACSKEEHSGLSKTQQKTGKKAVSNMKTLIKQATSYMRHDYKVMSPVCLCAGGVV